jgi:omega-6 fatty acid desaturase (delta-12 desaturase)
VYRVIRHPAALLLGGPIHLAVGQRFRGQSKATGRRQIASVWGTNVAIALVLTAAIWAVGWRSVVIAYVVPYYLAGLAGVWLFYVQHQFEHTMWDRNEQWIIPGALRGSSHPLPWALRWFTASIGLHHVHHIAPRIPNYQLQRCHDANAVFQRSPTLTLRSSMAALRLTLWDGEQHRLVGFRDVTHHLSAESHA